MSWIHRNEEEAKLAESKAKRVGCLGMAMSAISAALLMTEIGIFSNFFGNYHWILDWTLAITGTASLIVSSFLWYRAFGLVFWGSLGFLFAVWVLILGCIVLGWGVFVAANIFGYWPCSQAAQSHWDMQANMQPSKIGRGTPGIATVQISNKSHQVVVTDDILVEFPSRFFDGFIVDYPTLPPYKSRSEGQQFLGAVAYPSLSFSGTQIAASQTGTLSIPLVANNAGDYSGQIRVTTKIAENSSSSCRFSTANTITVIVLP